MKHLNAYLGSLCFFVFVMSVGLKKKQTWISKMAKGLFKTVFAHLLQVASDIGMLFYDRNYELPHSLTLI